MIDDISEDASDLELFHYGIKGMKWGVRRKEGPDGTVSSRVRRETVDMIDDKTGKKTKISYDPSKASVKNGKFESTDPKEARRIQKQVDRAAKKHEKDAQRQQERKENWKKPVSEDAEVAGKARDRTKKHGTDALSNKELQGLVTRMNLEQQYTQLMDAGKASSARRSGQAYISDILKDAGREFATETLKWGATEGVKYAFNRWGPGGGRGGQTSTAYRVPTNLLEGARKQIGR